MPFEADCVIEAMRVFAIQVAGQRELIAPSLPALIESMLHHGTANAAALMVRVDRDILDDAGMLSTLGQVIHNEQLVRAYDAAP